MLFLLIKIYKAFISPITVAFTIILKGAYYLQDNSPIQTRSSDNSCRISRHHDISWSTSCYYRTCTYYRIITYANNPSIIYADEPTGNLDSKTGQMIIDILVNINIKLNKTLIIVTHDPLIASYCNRVIWLSDGLISNEIREINREKLYIEIIENMKKL